MGRENKIVKPIFSGITPDVINEFNHADKDLKQKDTKWISDLKKKYNQTLETIRGDVYKLSLYEDLIIQLRCLNNLKYNMTLYVNKNKVGTYVYARTLFYTGCDDLKEIRVFMDKVEDLGTSDLVLLREDKVFMERCFKKLSNEMDKHISTTQRRIWEIEKQEEDLVEADLTGKI
jgi:hypothetical protein